MEFFNKDNQYIKNNILRQEVSFRGGGIEICLNDLYPMIHGIEDGAKMSAFQNYLGGGLLGSIQSDCNIKYWQENEILVKLSEELKEYFYSIMYSDQANSTYDDIQNRTSSAY